MVAVMSQDESAHGHESNEEPILTKRLRTPGAAAGGVIGALLIKHFTASIYSVFSLARSALLVNLSIVHPFSDLSHLCWTILVV